MHALIIHSVDEAAAVLPNSHVLPPAGSTGPELRTPLAQADLTKERMGVDVHDSWARPKNSMLASLLRTSTEEERARSHGLCPTHFILYKDFILIPIRSIHTFRVETGSTTYFAASRIAIRWPVRRPCPTHKPSSCGVGTQCG